MTFRYTILSLLAFFLFPIIYYQGKRIKRTIPDLPEAKEPKGTISAPTDQKFKLLTIGESTMAGVGVETHKEGFTGKLAELISQEYNMTVDWKVVAKSGITAAKVIKLIIPKLRGEEADFIIISLGGNDTFKFHSPDKWEKDITNLLDSLRIQFPSIPIVFTNMPPVKEFPAFTKSLKWTMGNLIELYGEKLSTISKCQPNVYFSSNIIRIKDWNQQNGQNLPPSSFFSDGVHPSKLTYHELAKEVAGYIFEKEIIQIPRI